MTRLKRMQEARALRGDQAERLACAFLQAQGWVIEQRNVRYPVGEIDLVAWEGRTLCLVEVRSTSSSAWGGPLASVTTPKQRRLLRAARWYLQQHRISAEQIRFDVVAVNWAVDPPALQLVRAAFTDDPNRPSW